MDAATVALVAACVALVVGMLSAAVAVWSAHKTAKTAREGRIEQRRADAYLQVLAIAEREGRWIESWIANIEELKVDERLRPPGPEVTDRATMSALLAACASSEVRDRYAAWRRKADDLAQTVRLTLDALSEDSDDEIVAEYLLPMGDGDLPREQALRRELAEVIAKELGHR